MISESFKTITPMGRRVLIQVDPQETKVGDIHLAKHSERTRKATVLAVGDECVSLSAGDRVLIFWSTGTHLHLIGDRIQDDLTRICSEHDVLAKFA